MAAWRLTIDLRGPWHADPDFTVEARDEIVRIIQDSGWVNPSLGWMLVSLAQTTEWQGFDEVFSWIYDLADADDVQLDTSTLAYS